MFGGAGLYCDGFFFALVADEAIYLKADDQNQAWYEERGSEPFIFDDGEKPMPMKYWLAPDTILTDPPTALEWGAVGLGAAKRKPPSTKKKRLKQGEG